MLQMEYESPGKHEYESNCKGLVFFSLRMQGCGGLWKGWKAKGLLHWNFSAEAAG